MRSERMIFARAAAAILGGFLLLGYTAGNAIAVSHPRTAPASEQAKAKFATLTSAELAKKMQQKDFYFVNVHIPYEGEIKNTDAFIDFDKISENLGKLPQDKSHPIVLYCQSGRMSGIAAAELARLGYSRVSHLAGGMIDWKRNGYEIIER